MQWFVFSFTVVYLKVCFPVFTSVNYLQLVQVAGVSSKMCIYYL